MGFDIIVGAVIGVLLAIWFVTRFRNRRSP
jgi:hypothetical protein